MMTQMVIATPAVQIVAELHERCDRCGAAAKAYVAFPHGDLAFCGHHVNQYADRISATATSVTVEAGFTWQGASSI